MCRRITLWTRSCWLSPSSSCSHSACDQHCSQCCSCPVCTTVCSCWWWACTAQHYLPAANALEHPHCQCPGSSCSCTGATCHCTLPCNCQSDGLSWYCCFRRQLLQYSITCLLLVLLHLLDLCWSHLSLQPALQLLV